MLVFAKLLSDCIFFYGFFLWNKRHQTSVLYAFHFSFHLSANGTPVFEASTGVFLRRTQLRPIEYDFYCLDGILDFSLSSSSCITEINEYIDIDRSCLREKMEEVLLVCTKDKDTTRDTDNEDNVSGHTSSAFLFQHAVLK